MIRPPAVLGSPITCKKCKGCPGHGKGPWRGKGLIPAVKQLTTLVGGKPVATQGDLGLCGAPTVLVASQYRTLVSGRPVLRVGDLNSCLGLIIGTGTPTTFIGT